ncbi:MAG TPA: GNAT family N-acetyltransferase, partial [Longimicrobiaceae bacterium]|nr:GNAT family N-acetyltransferase [Longimicrobiaceae bacterium]
MHPRIRRAVPDDAARLSEIARAAKARWGYPPEWLDAWREELTLRPEYLAEHRVLAAEAADGPVGVCALEDHADHWRLEHAWVDPAHQGRGIGQALVREALEIVRTIRPGKVRVVSDPHAAGFYLGLGARPAGT